MSQIPAEILRIGVEGETLLEVLPRMREAYCGTIAYQIEHLSSHQQRMWLRDMIETGWHRKPLEPEEKQQLLDRLIEVFGFERYLEKAYLGQKMFSIEGLDAVVPMLDELFEMAHTEGARDVVIGMAHRGRLSVLAHNLGRPVESILAEFEGAKAIEAVKAVAAIPTGGTGDVKYHYGHKRRLHDPRRLRDRRPALPEPEPPRVRRPGRHRRRPRRPDQPRGRPTSSTTRRPRCRCSSTATPPSPPRAWSRRRSTCSR